MKCLCSGAWAFLLLLALPLARAQDFRGDLVGIVEDVTGGRIVGAKIEAQSLDSPLVREAMSDSEGGFRVDDLPIGRYRVVVNAAGFSEARSEVTVVVSTVRSITVTLRPAPVESSISIQGEASSITTQPIDVSSAVHEAAVTAQDLETLPLAARSFANIAYLAVGTAPVEPSDPTKARITAVSSGGSSGLNMEASVDGGDNSDDYIGGFLQNFSPDAIQEFAVRTAQEDADTGRTTGASTVITTKHGTNEWHGLAGFYDRSAKLNARFPIDNPEPNPKQPFSRQNYVGTLGGPVKRDKLWFFSSFEYIHENASIAYSPASLAQFNALAELLPALNADLASEGFAAVSSIAVPSSVRVPFRDYLGLVRFDWAQSPKSSWFLRGGVDTYTTRNALVQQAALPSTGADTHNNYFNLAISNQYAFAANWLGSFVFDASILHLTASRNSNLGYALAFPFTATSSTISGFETFGDNQFVTPITAFPILRNQEKYQVRYDVSYQVERHAPHFGVNFIHEPVLSGALVATAETLHTFPLNPTDYLGDCQQTPNCPLLNADFAGGAASVPAGNGSFSQNVQRLGLYVQDSWRVTPRLTVNYGVRYDTTFGLFLASGHDQSQNPGLLTEQALNLPLFRGVPHDYRKAVAPRIGVAYTPGPSRKTVMRAGFGLFYNDLAQNGWVGALQAVNRCVSATKPQCTAPILPPAASNGGPGTVAGSGFLIDPDYKTPYAIHATAGVEHAFNEKWVVSVDYEHQQGVHAYRRYQYQAGFTLFSPRFAHTIDEQRNHVPNLTVARTDNRSAYNALEIHVQGNVTRRFNLVANYTLAQAQTWGCVLGELFDYVNGVCNPLHAFASGDYGPSGEDVRHRFVLGGTFHTPGGFELTTVTQAESARPFTLTRPAPDPSSPFFPATGDGIDLRAVVNGVPVALDSLRGTPYIQVDLRVARPFRIHERWSIVPFAEFFNLLNRNNAGANYVTNVAALPVPPAQVMLGNITSVCANPACASTQPISSLNQLKMSAGALGDFFGPGTTVGIPFAAQLGVRFTF